VVFCFVLSSDVWKESHESCALYSKSEFALVRRRDVRALLALDACVRIEEFLQNIGIFVVDVLDIMLFEKALLVHFFVVNK
jgi:hypothetical protein